MENPMMRVCRHTQLQRNTATAQVRMNAEKKWFMVFFEVEPSEVGARSRPKSKLRL